MKKMCAICREAKKRRRVPAPETEDKGENLYLEKLLLQGVREMVHEAVSQGIHARIPEKGEEKMTKDARKQLMLGAVTIEDLTEDEIKLIDWLADWEDSVAERFRSIVLKSRKRKK